MSLEQNPTTRAGGRHQVGLDWQADIMPFHSEICRGTATHNVELTRLQSVTQDSSRRLCAFVPTAARRLYAPLLLQTDRIRAALFSWKRSISHKPPMQVTVVMQAVALQSSGWAADTLRLTASQNDDKPLRLPPVPHGPLWLRDNAGPWAVISISTLLILSSENIASIHTCTKSMHDIKACALRWNGFIYYNFYFNPHRLSGLSG